MTYQDPANIHSQIYHAHNCRLGANTPQIGDLDCISILSKPGDYSTNRLSLHRMSRPFSLRWSEQSASKQHHEKIVFFGALRRMESRWGPHSEVFSLHLTGGELFESDVVF